MKANKFMAVVLAALTVGFVACKKDEPQVDKLVWTRLRFPSLLVKPFN